MIDREIEKELIEVSKEYPVVTVIGPRQSGKTTLVKKLFPSYKYCSLEDPDTRAMAIDDPRAFLTKYNSKVIFDEIQRAPELLSYIQTLVDEEHTKGRFILTGSHQLKLRAEVFQSLAGRTALLTLLPLTIAELKTVGIEMTRDEYLYQGFFPRIYNEKLNVSRAYSNYYQTYVERDVRQLIKLKDVAIFEKFMKLFAGRTGQLLNLKSLSNDVGVSSTTLSEWLSILEASFIAYKVSPYFENFGKRVVKSPKYYFSDVGLLCYLLGIGNVEQVERDPLVGNIFENLVVGEFVKMNFNKGKKADIYFFRDSNGNEVDLLIQKGRNLIPVEIKSSSTFNKSFAKGIMSFKKLTSMSGKGMVVYSGDSKMEFENYSVLNFKEIYTSFINRDA